jgi:hypothetical protein
MPKCRIESWEIQTRNPLKTVEKLGYEKYVSKYGILSSINNTSVSS